MFRKDLIPILLERPRSVEELSQLAGQKGSQTADDLEHLLRSLRHSEMKAVITPALCKKCGFEFSREKLRRPSRCPTCRGTWITQPLIALQMVG